MRRSILFMLLILMLSGCAKNEGAIDNIKSTMDETTTMHSDLKDNTITDELSAEDTVINENIEGVFRGPNINSDFDLSKYPVAESNGLPILPYSVWTSEHAGFMKTFMIDYSYPEYPNGVYITLKTPTGFIFNGEYVELSHEITMDELVDKLSYFTSVYESVSHGTYRGLKESTSEEIKEWLESSDNHRFLGFYIGSGEGRKEPDIEFDIKHIGLELNTVRILFHPTWETVDDIAIVYGKNGYNMTLRDITFDGKEYITPYELSYGREWLEREAKNK